MLGKFSGVAFLTVLEVLPVMPHGAQFSGADM